MLRIFFKYNRKLLYENDSHEMERMDYLEFIARVVSHIPDKGQGTVRYYGLYTNAHLIPIVGDGKTRRDGMTNWAERRVTSMA